MLPTKILLLSNPRHGTTFLIDNINKNEDIRMCYELLTLGEGVDKHYHECFTKIVDRQVLNLTDCEQYNQQRKQNEIDYFQHISKKFNNIQTIETIGYKIFAQQIDAPSMQNKVMLENVLAEFDKVIFLDRDMVSYAFSWLNAGKYGWSVLKRSSKDTNLVASARETQDIIRQTMHKHKLFAIAHKYLEKNNIPYLDLNYNDLDKAPELLSNFLNTEITFKNSFRPNKYDYKTFLANNPELSKAVDDQNILIDLENATAPPIPDFKRQENKLEAINVLHTGSEKSAEVNHFVNQIIKSFESCDLDNKLAKSIDLNIAISSNSVFNFSSEHIDILKGFFKDVNILTIEIPENKDFYFNEMPDNLDSISLEYGLKSGPNYVFFRCIDLMKRYNTCLFLEIDTYLKNNWLSAIANYVNSCGNFWISGPAYSGIAGIVDPDFLLSHHINGGTCIYNTGNHNFQAFIQWCEKIFPMLTKNNATLPYDYLIPTLYLIYVNRHCKESWRIVQLAKQNYIYNNLICNLSLEGDADETKDPVPGYIIHEKLKLD